MVLVHNHHQDPWLKVGPVYHSGSSMLTASNKATNSNQLVYEIYERPSCADCQKLIKHNIPAAFDQSHKYQILIFNTDAVRSTNKKIKAESKSWLQQNYVTMTPTIIVKYHGYPLYMYSGTQLTKWKQIAKGLNPINNQPFNKQIPRIEYVENSFTHSSAEFTSNKVTSLRQLIQTNR